MSENLSISDAWVWLDSLGSIRPRRVLKTHRESPKYDFFHQWWMTLLDGLSDGRPLLVNFHVGGTFVVGSKTLPGAIIYGCLFEREGKRRTMRAAVNIHNPIARGKTK